MEYCLTQRGKRTLSNPQRWTDIEECKEVNGQFNTQRMTEKNKVSWVSGWKEVNRHLQVHKIPRGQLRLLSIMANWDYWDYMVCLLVGCLTSQQHASVSQGRICTDNFTCCHTEIEAADQTFHLTQSQYTDTGPTSPSADPITPGAWQGSHWSANFEVTGMTRPRKNPGASGIRTRDLPLSRRTP